MKENILELDERAEAEKVGLIKKIMTGLKRGNVKDQMSLYLIFLPFILWYMIFAYKPMYGLIIAFKDYNLFR